MVFYVFEDLCKQIQAGKSVFQMNIGTRFSSRSTFDEMWKFLKERGLFKVIKDQNENSLS